LAAELRVAKVISTRVKVEARRGRVGVEATTSGVATINGASVEVVARGGGEGRELTAGTSHTETSMALVHEAHCRIVATKAIITEVISTRVAVITVHGNGGADATIAALNGARVVVTAFRGCDNATRRGTSTNAYGRGAQVRGHAGSSLILASIGCASLVFAFVSNITF